jgi:hypothetical protein
MIEKEHCNIAFLELMCHNHNDKGYIYQISPIDGAPVRFPYFFYDFDRIGATSLIYTGALVVLSLIIAHCFYLVDTKIRKS